MCTTAPRSAFVNHLEEDLLARAADSLLARGRVVEADRVVRALGRLREIRSGRVEHDVCGCGTSV